MILALLSCMVNTARARSAGDGQARDKRRSESGRFGTLPALKTVTARLLGTLAPRCGLISASLGKRQRFETVVRGLVVPLTGSENDVTQLRGVDRLRAVLTLQAETSVFHVGIP